MDEIVTPEVERLERLLDNYHTYGTGSTWFGVTIDTDHNYEMDLPLTTEKEYENIYAVKLEVTINRGSFF